MSGSVSGTVYVGGVVGAQVGGSITGCSSSATVKGMVDVGGVAGQTLALDAIYFYQLEDQSGVQNVAIDENLPVVYYNLQGVRVDNPENGIFIARQGSKSMKVVK